MLLVGTKGTLLDIDRSFTIAEYTSVTALAVNGTSAFAMLDAERVDRVEDFDCQPLAALPDPGGQSMAAIANGDGDLLVGMSGARLVRLTSGGEARPVSSFESVPGRAGWANPAGPSPDLRSVTTAEDGQWLVNVHVGGLWASDDEGGSWTALIEPEADVHEVAAAGGRLAVAAAGGAGWSEDRGHTWQWSTDGLEAPYARAVALDGDTIYVTSSTGPSTTAGALYRASVGHRFEKCAGGLPASFPFNIDTGSLAARAGRVAFGTRDGRLFESRDEGSSWSTVADHLGTVQCVKLG